MIAYHVRLTHLSKFYSSCFQPLIHPVKLLHCIVNGFPNVKNSATSPKDQLHGTLSASLGLDNQLATSFCGVLSPLPAALNCMLLQQAGAKIKGYIRLLINPKWASCNLMIHFTQL